MYTRYKCFSSYWQKTHNGGFQQGPANCSYIELIWRKLVPIGVCRRWLPIRLGDLAFVWKLKVWWWGIISWLPLKVFVVGYDFHGGCMLHFAIDFFIFYQNHFKSLITISIHISTANRLRDQFWSLLHLSKLVGVQGHLWCVWKIFRGRFKA